MEIRTRDPGIDERLLICFQLLLPIARTDNYITRNHRGIGQELGIHRTPVIAGTVEAINQSACLLELN